MLATIGLLLKWVYPYNELSYADDDFRDFVDKVPEGCRITIVSDSCHSGGLIDEAKEQIGESTKRQGSEESGL